MDNSPYDVEDVVYIPNIGGLYAEYTTPADQSEDSYEINPPINPELLLGE